MGYKINFADLLSKFIDRNDKIALVYLSSKLGYPLSSVLNWLDGISIPSLTVIVLLAKIFDLSDKEKEKLFITAGYPFLIAEFADSLDSDDDNNICISCHKQRKEVGNLIRIGKRGLFLCAECASESVEAFYQKGIFVRITRSIEFTREYRQAGILILNYFGTVLQEKYVDLDAKVRIEQEGLTVTLVIESPTGEQETIEKALNEYGLVIKGDMSPEEFYGGNVLKILELKQQLGIAKLQLEGQRDLLRITASQYDSRIHTLEEQIAWLRLHVGNLLEVNPHALTVHTEGGAYIHGNVATQGGDVVARDATVKRPKKKQKPIQS